MPTHDFVDGPLDVDSELCKGNRMDLRTFWRTIRVHWILLVALTIIGAVLGPMIVPAASTSYTATTTVIATAKSGDDVYAQNQRNQYIRGRVDTWAALATQSVVLQPVYMQLGPQIDYPAFRSSVTASSLPNSGVIQIDVVAPNQTFAKQAAEGIADQLAKVATAQDITGAELTGQLTIGRIGDTVAVRTQGESLAPLYAAGGAIVGLAIALVIAIIRARSTGRIRGRDDLDRLGVDLPVAVQLPLGFGSPRPVHTAGAAERGPLADAARRLRTAVLAAAPAGGTIVVTAATRGEGASLTASRLAVALGEAGHRVVLVDADLRRPTAFREFALEPNPGIGQVLADGAAAASVIQRSAFPTLDVLTAGVADENPSDLLGGTAATTLLTDLASEYDYVVVDTPPVSRFTDAAALGRNAAAVLLVVSTRKARRGPLAKAVDALHTARVDEVEIVLNRGRFDVIRGILTAGA